jgi:hypothetical protein
MISHNPFISQHSHNVSEPIYKMKGYCTWQTQNPNLRIWVAEPMVQY